MLFTPISVIVLASLSMLLYGQMRSGYKRGWLSMLLRIGSLVFCAFFGAMIAVALSPVLQEVLLPLIEDTEVYQNLSEQLGSVMDAATILLGMLVSLLLFLPVFFLLRGLVFVCVSIVSRRGRKGKRNKAAPVYKREDASYVERKDKAIGSALGVVSALLLTVVLFTPLVGVLKSTVSVIDIAASLTDDETLRSTDEVALLSEYSRDASVTVIDVLGGRMLFDMTARTQAFGKTTYLNKEIDTIGSINKDDLIGVVEKLSSADAESLEELEALLEKTSESLMLKVVLLEGIQDATSAWLNGQEYMGVARPSFGGSAAVDGFLNQLFYVCSTSTFETIDADIDTLMHIVSIFYERKDLFTTNNYEQVISELMESGAATLIRDELQKNAHMRSVLYAIDDMIMTVVSEELHNNLKYSSEECEALFNEVAQALTGTMNLKGTAKITAVAEEIKNSFDAYGVYVPDELGDKLAELLSTSVSGDGTSVSMEDVQNFFGQYIGTVAP